MKLYTVINNANSCYTGKFNTKEEAQALADKLNDEAIEQGNHQIFYNVGLVEFEDDTKELEQSLINYAINEANSDDVAEVLNVDADDIQGALVDFAEEWNEADEPSDADAVIDKWVARLKEVEHYFIGYAINMHEGDSECYVCTPQDIEDETGSCEPDENYLFPTREEAEKALEELREYSREKGYKLTFEIAPIEDLGEVEDVELTKGGYGHDTLTWSYMGKDYDCTGEFFIDKDNNLHHTFIAPSGKEIEIVTPYE